jgi:hypothetical protein
VGLLDTTAEEAQHSKVRRYVFTIAAFIFLGALGCWWLLRFHTEKKTIVQFFDALATGQTEQAYRIWKPQPTYSFQDFQEDWGPSGYYGPVKSFHIVTAARINSTASGVIFVVEVSPYEPFPSGDDAAKQNKTKEVRLWVERKDQSLSFPP